MAPAIIIIIKIVESSSTVFPKSGCKRSNNTYGSETMNGETIPTLNIVILSFFIIKCFDININNRYFEISIGWKEKSHQY